MFKSKPSKIIRKAYEKATKGNRNETMNEFEKRYAQFISEAYSAACEGSPIKTVMVQNLVDPNISLWATRLRSDGFEYFLLKRFPDDNYNTFNVRLW
jgi:hypothetical protein